MRYSGLMTSGSIVAFSIAISAFPAAAQTTSSDESSTSVGANEIIVTARKKSEKIGRAHV